MRRNNSLDTHVEVLSPSAQYLHTHVVGIFKCYADIRVWEFDESLASIVDVPVIIYRAATELAGRVVEVLEFAANIADDHERGAFMVIMSELSVMKAKAENIVYMFDCQQEMKFPESNEELRYLNGR